MRFALGFYFGLDLMVAKKMDLKNTYTKKLDLVGLLKTT